MKEDLVPVSGSRVKGIASIRAPRALNCKLNNRVMDKVSSVRFIWELKNTLCGLS